MSTNDSEAQTAVDPLQAAQEKADRAAAYVTRLRTIKQAEQEIPGVYNAGGVTMSGIAQKYGISTTTVKRILQDAGVNVKLAQRLTDEQRSEAVSMLRSGENANTVAQAFGVSHNTIRKLGLDAGVFQKGQRRPHRTDEEYAQIQEWDDQTRKRFGGAGLYNLGMGLRAWQAKKLAQARAEQAPQEAPMEPVAHGGQPNEDTVQTTAETTPQVSNTGFATTPGQPQQRPEDEPVSIPAEVGSDDAPEDPFKF